ncbi:MAG: monovalent cation/H(+) antiporter subunit G, partial [Elioraea tepidiphila]
MIEVVTQLVLIVLVLAGSGFALIAAIGIWRLPDALMRMHASSKSGTLG